LPPFKFACHILPRWQFFPATTRHINATLLLFLPQRGKFRATEWHSMPQRWHINATLLLFLPQRGKFRATEWHIDATLHLFLPPRGKFVPHFATFLNGGKILAGRSGPLAPCGMINAARGLCLYCLS